MTEVTLELVKDYLLKHGLVATLASLVKESQSKTNASSSSSPIINGDKSVSTSHSQHMETKLVAFNPSPNDPYGASSMPIYQTATFAQPGATDFGTSLSLPPSFGLFTFFPILRRVRLYAVWESDERRAAETAGGAGRRSARLLLHHWHGRHLRSQSTRPSRR